MKKIVVAVCLSCVAVAAVAEESAADVGKKLVNGPLTARNLVQPPAVVRGSSCSGNGVTTDASGQLLWCQEGVWQSASGSTSVEIRALQTSQMQAQLLANISTESQMQAQLLTQIYQDVHALQAVAPQDNTKFCYYDGKAYSEGAKRDGRTCENNGIRITGPDGRQKVPPLTWMVEKDK